QDNWGISRVRAGGSGGSAGEQFQVSTVAIDALLDEHGVETVQLLKMDIEGAELFALRGMATGLRDHRYERILLELHPAELREHGSSTRDVVEQLTAAKYTGWVVDHSPRSTRRAAYARHLRTSDFLRPLDAVELVDAWPHVLWTAPGVAQPESQR
ncbi:MAG: FkbM family methyltransferase, partial [Myxococcaceae bacterium]